MKPLVIDGTQNEAGFAQVRQVRSERFLREHLDQVRNVDFWRALNPHLGISDRPFSGQRAPVHVESTVVDRAARQVLEEGYFQTPPLLDDTRLDRLRLGVERIVAAGFPAWLTGVYDEFYQAFQGLEELFVPLLGPDYLMVVNGLSTFYVAPGDPGLGLWTALPPHRDGRESDPAVVVCQMPSILAVWIPLTHVTTLHSCLYVLPATGDQDYHSEYRSVQQERLRLQDARALPCEAGSVLGWSTHLIHWGSRSSVFADGPRIAISVYLQRRDVPPRPFSVAFDGAMPFGDRLTWLEDSWGTPGLFGSD